MLKSGELRKLSVKDLKAKAREVNEDIFKLRIQDAAGGLKNKFAVSGARRDLARVKTIINEKLGGIK